METKLQKDDIDLKKAFEIIQSIESLSGYLNEIAKLIHTCEFNRSILDKVLQKHGIRKVEDIKEELLDMLLAYINLVLKDHIITENEKRNVNLLKRLFKIKEGDFFNYRYYEIEEILNKQFQRIYYDDNIDKSEAIHKVELQEIFDLGYDQFEAFKEKEIKASLKRGANIENMDTTRNPLCQNDRLGFINKHVLQQAIETHSNKEIAKCTKCNGSEKLNYTYKIPLGMGGSNTWRNVQILCENCKGQVG